MVLAAVQVEPPEVLAAAAAQVQLGERPHLPVDLPPRELLLPEDHDVLVEVPLRVLHVLTADLAVRSDEGPALRILAEDEWNLPLGEELVADLAPVQQVEGIFEEDLQLLLVQPGDQQVFRVIEKVQLLDGDLLRQLLSYVTLIAGNLL